MPRFFAEVRGYIRKLWPKYRLCSKINFEKSDFVNFRKIVRFKFRKMNLIPEKNKPVLFENCIRSDKKVEVFTSSSKIRIKI